MQQQPPLQRRRKPKSASALASPSRLIFLAVAAASVVLATAGAPLRALAIVVTTPSPSPSPAATASPSATPLTGNITVLPLESSLFFVLDETISSHASAGSFVRAHLRDPLVVNGVTVAPKAAPVQIEVVHAQAAQMGNVDGEVEIYFEPLSLADGKKLTLNTPTAHINPHMSAGQYNTQAVEDTVGDIFVPYHYMYHMLRKGHEVELRPGTVIRARTAETVAIDRGSIVLASPRPFTYSIDKPHSDFSPVPFATPRENPTLPPKAAPSPNPTPTTTPS